MLTCKPVIVASSLKLWVVEVLKFICFVSLDSTELPSTVQKKKIKEEEEGSGGKTGLCQSFFFFFLGRLKAHLKSWVSNAIWDLPSLVLVHVSWCEAPCQQPRPASSRQTLPDTSMLSTILNTINMGQRFRPRGPNEGHKQQGEVLNEGPCKHKQANSPTE